MLVRRGTGEATDPGKRKGSTVQYLTVRESVRRLRAAGLDAKPRTVRRWIEERKVRDVWVLGDHTFIYEGELEALISGERAG